jgi:hypothetical protein
MKMKIAAALLIGITCIGSATASAGTVNFASATAAQSSTGAFGGSFTYLYNAASSKGQLTLSLANNTLTSSGNYLTAFGFNLANSPAVSLSLVSQASARTSQTGQSFGLISTPLNGAYGTYEWALMLKNTSTQNDCDEFLGSLTMGDSTKGIAAAEIRNFTFDVTGSGAVGLSASSFLTQISTSLFGSGSVASVFRNAGSTNWSPSFGGAIAAPPAAIGGSAAGVPLPSSACGGLALMAIALLGRRTGPARRSPSER